MTDTLHNVWNSLAGLILIVQWRPQNNPLQIFNKDDVFQYSKIISRACDNKAAQKVLRINIYKTIFTWELR